MANRRAGQRLRNLARRRHRDLVRAHWSVLLRGTLLWLVLAAASTTLALLMSNTYVAVFLLGGFAGAYIALALAFLSIIDPTGRRLTSAADAEEWTALELRRLTRSGWKSVHNLHFAGGDVDHVAVGPGGVVVVETKQSDGDWTFLRTQRASGWADQARVCGFRTRHLLKSRTGISLAPHIVIALWAQSPPDEPVQFGSDVVVVRGRRLREHLETLAPTLDHAAVDRIFAALNVAGEQFDAANGLVPDGWLRRSIGLG